MVDVVDKLTRSRMMSGIRGRNTKPELLVRRHLHRAGLRYSLKSRLPGSPDLVFPRHQAVIFVHGCFWHRHADCAKATTPSSNVEFWSRKFEQNVRRDERAERELKDLGWRVFVVWECGLDAASLDRLAAAIRNSDPVPVESEATE